VIIGSVKKGITRSLSLTGWALIGLSRGALRGFRAFIALGNRPRRLVKKNMGSGCTLHVIRHSNAHFCCRLDFLLLNRFRF